MLRCRLFSILSYFNPRSRKGFDGINSSAEGRAKFQSTKPQRLRRWSPRLLHTLHSISIHEAAKASTIKSITSFISSTFQSTKPQRLRPYLVCFPNPLAIFQSTKPQRLRQQKHPKNNLIFKNNLYTYYNIPAHNNYILIILNLFTIKSTIFQVRISRDFHVHFLFAPNNSILKYHN